MNPVHPTLPVESLLALLLVASATAVIVKWVRVPYPVALVVAGLIIGISNVLPPVIMTPELVLVIFLPALLFEASWNLDIKALKRDWLPITMLATVGVLVCMFSVAALLHLAGGMNIQNALLFGAMVSATDPVSVVALFRQMGMDARLTMIIEGESLFNDGTAVVLFQMVLTALVSGAQPSIPVAVGSFAMVMVGGALLGASLGYAASRITSAFDDHLLEITLTMVTAYGGFLIAEHLKVSPVITVVVAGIVVGNYGSRTGMSATTRLAVNSFWEYAAFLVNSILFLLIGLQVQVPLLLKHAQLIGFGVLAVMISRMLVVYGICPFVSTERLPIPDKWRHLLFWGGLRGALVMALALSLPLNFPDREAVVNLTFGVVLFTLLVPGLTIEPLVRLLGMAPKQDALIKYQRLKALLFAYKSESQKLTEMLASGHISNHIHDNLGVSVQKSLNEVQKQLEELEMTDLSIDQIHLKHASLELIEHRKDCLLQLVKRGLLTQEVFHELELDMDSELDLLTSTIASSQTPN
ncbi:MAG: Na+/H+ antiporter [Candidatus Obscuribacterales bacterium]|nr:Na+/H+ antiporter [Candidatus Obscuribacterales bacterium]